MDETFETYILFGEYYIENEFGRYHTKQPLAATLSLPQAEYEWQIFDQHRDWLPKGATFVNCYFSVRNIELYPEG